jgi:hypothetical protein
MIVFARGLSTPLSMIVVHRNTSAWPCMNSRVRFSRSRSGSCPCATITFASGTVRESICAIAPIVCTRLCTRNTCPPRRISRRIASRITSSE